MAALYDIDSKQISDAILAQQGISALLNTSAFNQQRLLAAYEAEKQRADEYKRLYEEEKARADKAQDEIEYWKKLAQRPKLIFKDNARLDQLVAGDLYKEYAEDNSIQGQQPLRPVSAG